MMRTKSDNLVNVNRNMSILFYSWRKDRVWPRSALTNPPPTPVPQPIQLLNALEKMWHVWSGWSLCWQGEDAKVQRRLLLMIYALHFYWGWAAVASPHPMRCKAVRSHFRHICIYCVVLVCLWQCLLNEQSILLHPKKNQKNIGRFFLRDSEKKRNHRQWG